LKNEKKSIIHYEFISLMLLVGFAGICSQTKRRMMRRTTPRTQHRLFDRLTLGRSLAGLWTARVCSRWKTPENGPHGHGPSSIWTLSKTPKLLEIWIFQHLLTITISPYLFIFIKRTIYFLNKCFFLRFLVQLLLSK
jgi:hypothetical protein